MKSESGRMPFSFRQLGDRLMAWMISDAAFAARQYEKKTGKQLNIESPRTFNEKLQWLKLHYRKDLLTQCVDKYAVRDFVKNRVGSEILIPLYGVYDRVEDIDITALPQSFVLKVNHGCGQNILCRDKDALDWKQSRRQLRRWMGRNYYYYGREWAYKNIVPKIVCEEYLGEDDGPPQDFKLFCFDGVPEFLEVHSDRFGDHNKNLYDMDWNVLDFRRGKTRIGPQIAERPLHLDRIVDCATRLSRGFPFVRVDLYYVDDKVYFGEMTFYPSNGTTEFYPEEYNLIWGSRIRLPAD